MKVLFFSPSSLKFGGGGERWLLEVARRLSRLGCKTEIITTGFMFKDVGQDESIPELFKQSGIDVVELPYIRPPFGGLLPTSKSLTTFLKLLEDIDVVYFMYSFIFQDMTMVLMKYLTGKPVINGIHEPSILSGPYGNYCRSVGRKVMKSFDSHHVLNNYYRSILKGWGLKNVHLIPNGVDTDRFKPLNQSRNCHDKFEVLFIGRLNLRKGIDILHDAIVMLNRELTDNSMEFVIVGKGPYIHLVKNLENRYGNVKHIDYIPSEELPRVYSSSHLFVLPSRQEGMPLVALEAQSSGLPVVASNIPGPMDFIRDGVTGSLISPAKPETLATYIKHYYELWSNSYEKYLQISVKARENALKFDWNQIVKQIHRMLYAEVLKNKA